MLLLAFALVLLNGFFVATEFALVKVRATRLQQLAAQGNASAAIGHEMVTHLDAYLSACQVGITLASLALGWIGEPAFAELLAPLFEPLGKGAEVVTHAVSIAVAFLIITVLHIVVGEQAPKILAIAKPEPMTLLVARPMRLFYRLFYPFVQLLNRATRALLLPLGVHAEGEGRHSEEEARMILAESLAGGRESDTRRRLVERAFEFSMKRARQFMVPRADIVFLDVTSPLEENMETARRMGFTRYPLVRGALDNVLGIVHIRDLTAGAGRLRSSEDLVRVAREPLFLPESSPADVVLRQFQARRLHQAVVVDEYGGTSGLVTLEDLLEELIGSEIQDEFDAGEAAPLLALGAGNYSVAGGFALSEIVALLEETLEDPEEAVTVGGYVQNRLGRLGRVGDVVELGERHALQVLETRQRRVLRVLVGPREKILPQAPPASATLATEAAGAAGDAETAEAARAASPATEAEAEA